MRLRTVLTCNNIEALIGAATQGVGLAYLPDFLLKDAITQGQLQAVLGEYLRHAGKFWLLWPSSGHRSPKLRVFVDFLSLHVVFSGPPHSLAMRGFPAGTASA